MKLLNEEEKPSSGCFWVMIFLILFWVVIISGCATASNPGGISVSQVIGAFLAYKANGGGYNGQQAYQNMQYQNAQAMRDAQMMQQNMMNTSQQQLNQLTTMKNWANQ